MPKTISHVELDDPANDLRKAHAIIDLMIDSIPVGGDETESWRMAAIQDFVFRSLQKLDALIRETTSNTGKSS